nr:EOG090X0O5J [Macrothrix elegans]
MFTYKAIFKNVLSVSLRSASRGTLYTSSKPLNNRVPETYLESHDGDMDSTSNSASEKTINSVTLLGRVGSNPVKRGSSDHPLITFSLATNSNYSHPNGTVSQKTEWHRICVFKPNLRDIALQYTAKGQRVLVQGRILYGELKDSEGNSKTTASIIADEIIFFRNS